MKPLLTIFTPTYNRAYILNKCYESLKKQTLKNFEWLIIDDGSTDNTRELVGKWINSEEGFKIRYIYQENQGMHGAHNTAYENIETELNVCIDSDDYMPSDAVEKICSFWNKNSNLNGNIAGIVALDAYEDKTIIGSKLPENIKTAKLFDLYHKNGVSGDKKLVYRTEITQKYPYPIFDGEKYVGLAYKYYKIDEKYELLLMNEIICIVEYMEDGSSRNMLRQYIKNPKGWSFYRIENLKRKETSLTYRFKESVHYVVSSIFSKNINFIKNAPQKVLIISAIPLGIILATYIKLRVKN